MMNDWDETRDFSTLSFPRKQESTLRHPTNLTNPLNLCSGLDKTAVEELLNALQQGNLRAASRGDDGIWRVEPRVKQGILQAFRVGSLTASQAGCLTFVDKDNLPPQRFSAPCCHSDGDRRDAINRVSTGSVCPEVDSRPLRGFVPKGSAGVYPREDGNDKGGDQNDASHRAPATPSSRSTQASKGACASLPRVVPGGTAVRRGAYLGPGVVVMPPAYINVGAYVDANSLVDSHALVGSCAQVGKRVHLSAAAQLGGVLEPVGALPVIVEDDVFVGGGVGIYEGTVVRRGAVVGAGVQLTVSAKVYDVPRERVITASSAGVLEIPERAVVVAGARPVGGAFAREHGIQIATPVIVKYRDERTDAKTVLEQALRSAQ